MLSAEIVSSGPTREPQQGRSRASYERMLSAAEGLLIERGTDDFTLTEVSKRGKVSIGSIYCRFDSKDDLIRTVQNKVLGRVVGEETALIEGVRKAAHSLSTLIPILFDAYAESLRKNAPILRPLMMRAATDSVVSGVGKQAHFAVRALFNDTILDFRHEINHPNPARAVLSCYRTFYAAIARWLGFGLPDESAREGDWEEVKADLAEMCVAYLTRER